MVPFGETHIFFRPNSSTRASSGRDGRALDADAVLLDRVRGVDGDLVVGGVAALDAEVVVLEVDVEVGVDQPVLDELPDDPGHLVAVELDDGFRHLDLRHRAHTLRTDLAQPLRPHKLSQPGDGTVPGPPAHRDIDSTLSLLLELPVSCLLDSKEPDDLDDRLLRRRHWPTGLRLPLAGLAMPSRSPSRFGSWWRASGPPRRCARWRSPARPDTVGRSRRRPGAGPRAARRGHLAVGNDRVLEVARTVV